MKLDKINLQIYTGIAFPQHIPWTKSAPSVHSAAFGSSTIQVLLTLTHHFTTGWKECDCIAPINAMVQNTIEMFSSQLQLRKKMKRCLRHCFLFGVNARIYLFGFFLQIKKILSAHKQQEGYEE